jgi:murein DD-endopeptidase MepM/ murein hydrolase activator NlpD
VALVAGAAAVASVAAAARGQVPDEVAGVLARVVPGGRLGQYRHGTYPSSGNRTHAGVDIVAPCGTPVLALEAGTVVDRIRSRSEPDFSSLGYMFIVEHPQPITGRAFYSLYLHLQSPPSTTERVARGDELGRVGATGRATGCHLHLEVRYFRDRVSPRWEHIYGPGDQRASRYFRQHWEDPVAFIARLERPSAARDPLQQSSDVAPSGTLLAPSPAIGPFSMRVDAGRLGEPGAHMTQAIQSVSAHP